MNKHIFNAEAHFEQLTLAVLEKVEKNLHVKLPNTYIDLMKQHNGGTLAYTTLISSRLPDGEAEIDEIKGIDLEEGIIESNYLTNEWELDSKLIIFAGDGNYWLAFDYRKHDSNEPAVVYIEEDTDNKPIKIAKNFALFLKKLHEPEDEDAVDECNYDPNEFIYTKEQFEQFIQTDSTEQELFDCIYQFGENDSNMNWYVDLALLILKIKTFSGLSTAIVTATATKLDHVAKENWPIEKLKELVEIVNNSTDMVEGYASLILYESETILKKIQ